jgi:GT2 family glycosyltransferase
LSAPAYKRWIADNEPNGDGWTELGRSLAPVLATAPLTSILMPVHDPRPEHLMAAVSSVKAQLHPGWELCIADDGSRSPTIGRLLAEVEASDPRIGVVRLPQSVGVAAATNAALVQARGGICLFLDHDDELPPHAVALVAQALVQNPDAVGVYSDEDTVDLEGRRSAPVFKPELDRERLLRQNYVNHAFAVRTEVLRRLGGLSAGLDGAQDHDLVLRVSEAGPIIRLPHILYHWRSFPGGRSLSQTQPARMSAAREAAVDAALRRRKRSGRARAADRRSVEIEAVLPDPPPSLAAIVPTRDGKALLKACAAGLLTATDYPGLELHIIDNGSEAPETLAILEALSCRSNVRVHRIDSPFNFSALNNAAARTVDADLLLFMNDDVLVGEAGWLRRMAALALIDDVGAVGAKLVYPDGRIQHAGLVLGLGPQGVAGHEFRAAPGDTAGPQARLQVTREASAVTAACMLVERRKFEQVGGFDERLAVAFNDVDLCLRLRAAGLRNIWTPEAQLVHMESATRGSDLSPERAARFAGEVHLMHVIWGAALRKDPYYNPNLTLQDESFTPARVSRASLPGA